MTDTFVTTFRFRLGAAALAAALLTSLSGCGSQASDERSWKRHAAATLRAAAPPG